MYQYRYTHVKSLQSRMIKPLQPVQLLHFFHFFHYFHYFHYRLGSLRLIVNIPETTHRLLNFLLFFPASVILSCRHSQQCSGVGTKFLDLQSQTYFIKNFERIVRH